MRTPHAALLCCFLLTSAIACTVEPESETGETGETKQSIYNGYIADSGQFPEVVYVSAGTSMCTGTLIAPTTVLTAAHCLDHYPASSSVSVGFGNGTSPLDWFPASSYELHPDFDMDYLFGIVVSSHHDTALVHLALAAPYPLARLVSPNEEAAYVTDSAIAWVAGFGENNLPGGPSSGIKMWGTGYVSNVKNWVTRLDSLPSSACFGDSGGPFYVSVPSSGFKQAGVLSFGPSSCETWNKYARITLDLWWIHQNAALPCDSGFPCTQRCGDYTCDHAFESHSTCPADCGYVPCGDGVCDPSTGDESYSCPVDCYCGDGVCDAYEYKEGVCESDCSAPTEPYCGDGNCDPGEDRYFCEQDCH